MKFKDCLNERYGDNKPSWNNKQEPDFQKPEEFNIPGKSREYYHQEGDRFLIFTDHSTERSLQRQNHLSIENKKLLFSKLMNGILKNKKWKNRSGEYLVFSKSLRYGLVFDYRPDGKMRDGKNHFIVITVLPKNRKEPQPGTQLVFTEGVKNYIYVEVD